MKRLLTLIFGLAIWFEMAGQVALTAGSMDAGAPVGSFDYDMRALRYTLTPEFNYNYGDWIQYLPGAATWGLKVCGVPGRSDWGQMVVSHAGGTVASLILDHGGKWVFDRMRPDQSRNNSFPSGHTTTAFLTATWLQKEYGESLPWLSGIGYGIAVITAQQRILRNKHWTTDTMAGAVLGIAAGELGYWLSDRIFGKHKYKLFDEFSYDTSLQYWNISYWYSRRLAFDGRHGAAASLQVQAPLSAHCGLAARCAAGNVDDTRAILSALCGAYYVHQAASKAEIGAHVLAGAGWWNNGSADDGMPYSWHADGCGFDFVAGFSAAYILTQSAKVRLIAEWEAFPVAGWLNSINLGIGGSVYF